MNQALGMGTTSVASFLCVRVFKTHPIDQSKPVPVSNLVVLGATTALQLALKLTQKLPDREELLLARLCEVAAVVLHHLLHCNLRRRQAGSTCCACVRASVQQ